MILWYTTLYDSYTIFVIKLKVYTWRCLICRQPTKKMKECKTRKFQLKCNIIFFYIPLTKIISD